MIYKHLVKYNGVYYPAGTDVPVGVKPVEEIKKVEEVKVVAEPIKEVAYTKTEINRMSTADLKKLAKSEGIKDVADMSGAELKKVLIDKFAL